MRVLVVLSSSNQMYSGIGRAVFEFAARLAERAEFEFAIDDGDPRNLGLVEEFGRRHGLPVHVGAARKDGLALDHYNADLPALVRGRRWDAIECVCFANAGTNGALLDALGDRVTLAYTPHDQPAWTVPMSPAQADHMDRVHQRVLERSDVVLCDSPAEREGLQGRVPHRNHCAFVALGCDFAAFRPGPPRRGERLLFVGDLAEPRKRFDRVLAVFARLLRSRPGLRLVVIGNKSDRAIEHVPADLRHAIELRGYVSEADLRRAYAESAGLLLLSDFEAFGIPILEALACGTPVFLSEQAATRSLFGPFRAAHFCPADDPDATAEAVSWSLARGRDAIGEALADRRRLQATFDWETLAYRKWQALASAWFRRNCWAATA
jgi:glycosyltransferase involved in cell wall biosynthesis